MNILRFILIVVEVLSCLMLIGVILLQQSKSQGMGVAFGGGMGETLFGSRAGNILTKTTITLAIIFLANTAFLGILYTSEEEKSLVESASTPAPIPGSAGGSITPPPAPQGGGMMTAFDEEGVAPAQNTINSTETVEDSPSADEVIPSFDPAPVSDEVTTEPVSP